MRLFHNLSRGRKLTLIIMVATGAAILMGCAVFPGFDIYDFRQSRVRLQVMVGGAR
jgi:predicted cupin superfamily sugar epimerase